MTDVEPAISLRDPARAAGASDGQSRAATSARNYPPHVTASLAGLFWLADRAPWVLRLARPLAVRCTLALGGRLRSNLARNARQIFGRVLGRAEGRAFARAVVGNFYDFVADVGRSSRATAEQLRGRVASVHGEDRYADVRSQRRGALLVTAHMGAFEVGLAALRGWERDVHVVFKRDAFDAFERIRSRVRQNLGVREAPIDDGIASLVRLRDALRNDEVVVMQADRAMPGQRAQVVPFLSGRLSLPVGPVKLARLTGSPIVPVFIVRLDDGRFTIHLDAPIEAGTDADASDDDADPALRAIARSIETFVGRFPEQWLVLDPVFVDDAQ